MMNLQLPPHYCKTDVMRSVLIHADCFDVFVALTANGKILAKAGIRSATADVSTKV